jgi:hypothetical protein
MPITPRNNDPLKDYVTPGNTPSISSDGLVYNKIYAHNGIVDTLHSDNKISPYHDPTINLINSNNYIQFNPATTTSWISQQDFGGDGSTPVVLSFYFTNKTYFNFISFNILNVPCYIELLYADGTPLSNTSSFIIDGGTDINTTTDWVNIRYQLNKQFNQQAQNLISIDAGSYLQIRITRQKSVQRLSKATNTLTDIPYSVGVKNFSLKLNIQTLQDVPTNSFVVQNKFGFIETYSKKTYSINNAIDNNSSTYWKCAPQPVGDAIVNYYLKLDSSTTITSVNRLYINPVHDGCKFNLYYTTDTGSDPSTFTWSPVQRDFSLRSGIYELPIVQCTYLKLEFVQLAPEVYDLPYENITTTINVFPFDVEKYFSDLESTIIDGKSKTYSYFGSNNNTQPAYTSSYSTLFGAANDINAYSWPSIGSLESNELNSSVNQPPGSSIQVIDPTISYKLINPDGSYNDQSYSQFLQRKFPNTGKHNYSQIAINHSWHQAYFVGLYYIAAFYETTAYDNIQPTLSSLLSNNGSNTFAAQNNNSYIQLNPDDTATTPWSPTIDKFTGFSIAGLTTDWQSFLTDQQVLLNDTTNLITSNVTITGTKLDPISNLGTSSVIGIVPVVSGSCYVQTGTYPVSSNIANYNDANFLNGTTTWSGLGSTTLTNTTVSVYSGAVVSGITVSGGQYSAAYSYSLPGVYSASGTQSWMNQYGSNPLASVGFGSYLTPSGGLNYYFLVNAQVTGISGVPQVNTNLTFYTRFINPITGLPISGTTVTGTVAAVVSGIGSNSITFSGSMWSSSIPSNTVQMVVSGATSPFNLYNMSVSATPVGSWIGPSDRNSMRVSAVARILLPSTSNGTYRMSLLGTDYSGNVTEIAYKQYDNNSLPVGTWINIEVPGYSGYNYKSFSAKIAQIDSTVKETFYISMLSPFYHPVRYEYTTISGSGGWIPIMTGVNDPQSVINVSKPGTAASGIQVRLTALDPNVTISALSIVPRYAVSPYFIGANIDYIGDSKTNELSSRMPISRKKLFLLSHEVYPERFSVEQVASTTVSYVNM